MSRPAPFRRRPVAVAVLLLVLVGLGVGVFFVLFRDRGEKPGLPGRSSEAYKKYVAAFQLGLAALELGPPAVAFDPAADGKSGRARDFVRDRFTEAIETIPEEPAAWADRGLWFLRNNRLKEAEGDLRQAERLAPDSPAIQKLLGLLDKKNEQFGKAAERFRASLKQDPKDLPALYALYKVIEQESGPGSDQECLSLLNQALALEPNNLTLLKEKGLVAVRLGDQDALRQVAAAYRRLEPGWSGAAAADARKELQALEAQAGRALGPEIAFTLTVLNNTLIPESAYVRDRQAVDPDESQEGEPIQQFLLLAPMRASPSPPDLELAFEAASPPGRVAEAIAGRRWDVVLPVWLTLDAEPTAFVADGREVRRAAGDGPPLPFPGGPKAVAPTAHGIIAADWNDDSRTDFLLAGAGGLRLFEQGEDGQFTDVTAATGLDKATLTADYFGAWPANVALGSGLGLILAPRTASPVVLSNDGEGASRVTKPFPGVRGARDFVWADIGRDGVPGAAFVDAAGGLRVFANDWHGHFREQAVLDGVGKALALAVADVTGRGAPDLIVLYDDGAIRRLSYDRKAQAWDVHKLARWADFPGGQEPGSLRLLAADLDNNGAVDLIVTGPRGTRVWLGEEPGRFVPRDGPVAEQVFAAADLTRRGRLDLLALSELGQPVIRATRGTKGYHGLSFRPHCRDAAGRPGRAGDWFNSFGIGGHVEIRTGPILLRQPMVGPVVHFGLGEQPRVNVARLQWPDGPAQAEYSLDADRAVAVNQRIPW